MSTREKVIIVLMGLAIVIGGYFLLFNQKSVAEPKERPKTDETELNTLLVTMSAQKATQKDSLERTIHVLEMASKEWSEDPLIQSRMIVALEKRVGINDEEIKTLFAGVTDLKYTGFISGTKRLAVINGVAYGVGEELEFGATKSPTSNTRVLRPDGTPIGGVQEAKEVFYVRGIAPTQVIIGRRGTEAMLVIDLEEFK